MKLEYEEGDSKLERALKAIAIWSTRMGDWAERWAEAIRPKEPPPPRPQPQEDLFYEDLIWYSDDRNQHPFGSSDK